MNKRKNLIFSLLLPLVFSMGLTARARAYTAADYYSSGLRLYNEQDYGGAIQFFSAALGLDPNYSAALMGRANSYYEQTQYQEALTDYEKVQSLTPSPKLARIIQYLKTKVDTNPLGTGGEAQPIPDQAVTAGSPFAKGVAFYQKKQYQEALPLFQQAVKDNPDGAHAYYYLGLTQMTLGDTKDACVNLTLSDRKLSNPSVKPYVNDMKSKLSPADQKWVDEQLQISQPARSSASVGFWDSKRNGFRVAPGLNFFNLGDFQAHMRSNQAEAQTLKGFDPTYQFIGGTVPSSSINLAGEIVFKPIPNLEFGLPVGYLPLGLVTETVQNSGSVTWTDNFSILAVPVGANLRYLFTRDALQPWVAAGALLTVVDISYDSTFDTPSESSSGTLEFFGLGLGAQASTGLDIHIGDYFVLSGFGGYQFSSVNSLNTLSLVDTTGATAKLEVVPTSNGNIVTPVSNGNYVVPVADGVNIHQPGDPVPAGSRPLKLDLSGPYFGLMFSAFF